MDKEHEMNKLREILKIPIVDVAFFTNYCEIYSTGKVSIGTLPVFTVAGIVNYETGKELLGWLRWHDVYIANKDSIDQKVVEAMKADDIDIRLGVFRTLYVYNNAGVFQGSCECVFDNEWSVYLIQ